MFKGLRRSLLLMGIGALFAYFWDTEKGEERRAQLLEQVQGMRDQSQGLMQQGQGIVQQGQQRVNQLKDTAKGSLKNAQNNSSSTDSTTYAPR